MSVGKYCRRDVVSVRPDQSLSEAARSMTERGVGCVIAVEEGRPVGILTDRDLALAVAAQDIDPYKQRVDELASSPVVAVQESTPLREAIQTMATHGLRRLPVVNGDGALTGLITVDDIVPLLSLELALLNRPILSQSPGRAAGAPTHAILKSDSPEEARRHFLRDVVSISEAFPVSDVAKLMSSQTVGCVVVTDRNSRPIGIITDRDLMRRVPTDKQDLGSLPAREVMSKPVVTVGSGASLEEVSQLMHDRGVRRVPVVDDDVIRGIVSLDDLLVALGRELADVGTAIRHALERSRRDQRLEKLRDDLHAAVDRSLERARGLGEKAQDKLLHELQEMGRNLRKRAI